MYASNDLMKLLPAIYRLRDAEQGGSLAGLLGVLASQAQVVDDDIAHLYENLFIETCDEWVVAYIADLLGVRGLHPIGGQAFSQRARVANTLLFRQRKGTATMLEQLARDTTGWPAKVLECFQDLGTTQHLKHPRLTNYRTPDLRNVNQLELLDSGFDSGAHTGDVRHISSNRGRYNIPNVGIFLWRLQSYTIGRGRARPAASPDDGRYFFNPLGGDVRLFNRPQTETHITHLAEEINVPGELRRRPLFSELEARRAALVAGREIVPRYFGDVPVVRVWLNNALLQPEEIAICNLGDPDPPIADGWPRPPAQKTYNGVPRTIRVGVDPKLGRLALPSGVPPTSVEVGYTYGFSGDVGAGPFDRSALLRTWIEESGRSVTFQEGVTRNAALLASAPNPGQLKQTLSEAIADWKVFASTHPNAFGLITVFDSDTYTEDLTAANTIDVPAGCVLAIVAAEWPVRTSANQVPFRTMGDYVPTGLRPLLQGNVAIRGLAGTLKGELILDGLVINGNVSVLVGDLGTLRLGHVTIVPPRSLSVNASSVSATQNVELEVEIQRSIVGPINLPDTVPTLTMVDSIAASTATGTGGASALVADGATVTVHASTVFGTVHARSVDAGNSIFTGLVTTIRRQVGCLRFCYVSDDSQTGRRYRCQPDLVLEEEPDASLHAGIRLRTQPSFTSSTFGQPGYAQLSQNCASEISGGAEDGSEMGVFNYLKQPQREVNLRSSLEEYLRFGLEAGVFFVS
jgi:hypothetical protein